MYLAFRYGVKSTIFGTTNGFARVKNSRLIFLVLGGGKNFAEEISKALLFCLVTLLVTLQEQPSVSPTTPGQQFDS